MKFNEDSRVKIPAILHLTRLGYKYFSLKDAKWNLETNIFEDIFSESIRRINPDFGDDDVKRLLDDLYIDLSNEDLGRAFYNKLINRSGIKLIDFDNFDNNSFHVCTELTYQNGDDEFRPDVITLINGMPIAFIEVKKPSNRDGVLAERKRINTRFSNKKFRKFVNITQLLIFSNNMEYPESQPEPLMGAFYSSTAYGKSMFNYFREEENFDLDSLLRDVNSEIEDAILKDNNLIAIKHAKDFQTNKDPDSPTNRILTSLLQRDRLKFLLQYAITYVNEKSGLQKHIMRYPQIFATKAIEQKLDEGLRKGIIWHTQGSGKTALAYYNVQHLQDYYQSKGIIPKFYFIVDRIDLMKQAQLEFSNRDLKVNLINSKSEFAKEMKQVSAVHNFEGKSEITVVNIQKFSEDTNVVERTDYSLKMQRIFFMDEVHRSYNPEGSFLANLQESDPNSIKIGLTGTPLIGKSLKSRDLFGDYIHKYYYNASIADGYTLRLIREDIRSEFKIELAEALKEIQLLKGDLDRRKIYAHPKFVEPMLDYIIEDFQNDRYLKNDSIDIGGMVICDSSLQAKEMYKIYNSKYGNEYNALSIAAEDPKGYGDQRKERARVKSAALILYDIGSKDDKDQWVNDFKAGNIDLIFVDKMLLTGFNAPRLKKLYMGKVIKAHNLLQALTRVNRTYKSFKYGYVVDFADIKSEFDITNKAYFDELQNELGDELGHYSDLFMTREEMIADINHIKDVIWKYDTSNLEAFSQQIQAIENKEEMRDLVKSLRKAKSLYNIMRTVGEYDLLDKLDFKLINRLAIMAQDQLNIINTKEALEKNVDTTNLLNIALEDIVFKFTKVGEEELVLAGKLKDSLRKTREAMGGNFDPQDPMFVNLYEELERLFKKKNLSEVSQEEMKKNIKALTKIYDAVKELNRKNQLLAAKYDTDRKYARVHKRIMASGKPAVSERQLNEALVAIKVAMDEDIQHNSKLMQNEAFFDAGVIKIVIKVMKNDHGIDLDLESAKSIKNLIVTEYLNEYHGIA